MDKNNKIEGTNKMTIEQLKDCSIVDLPFALQKLELYDEKKTQEIFDLVAKQYSGNLMKEIGEPVFASIIDGLWELKIFKGINRKLGLTTERVINECRTFSYKSDSSSPVWLDGYVELKNERDREQFYERMVTQKYSGNRSLYEDKGAMERFKEKSVHGKIKIKDDYTDKDNLYVDKEHVPANYKDPKWRKLAEPDHITPLAQTHKKYKDNYAIDDADIKRIVNEDYNFAMTAAEINDGRGKGGRTNKEYIQYCKDKGIPIPAEQAEKMIKMQMKSEKAIEKGLNLAVLRNLLGKIDLPFIHKESKDILEKRIRDYEKKHGKLPTDDKLESIVKRTELEKEKKIKELKKSQKEKQKKIVGTAAKNAAAQAGMQMIGNVVLFLIKPLYYEVSDMFSHGLTEGVGTESGKEALAIRFGRIKNYVIDHMKSMKGLSIDVMQVLKDFLLALIEGIINMFVGLLKRILKVIKEGIKIAAQSWEVLFGKEAKNTSAKEKGDAILKLIGASTATLCGIGVEHLLDELYARLPLLPQDSKIVFSTMFTGIAAALVMYILDRADLFNVKKDQRDARIKEVFAERRKDIESANVVMTETLRKKTIDIQEAFTDFRNCLKREFSEKNMRDAYLQVSHIAVLMGVRNPYEESDADFLEIWKTSKVY